MADLVSPGILVQEKDLTNTIPPVGGSSAGIAAAFAWGPADEITTITSENELVSIFGQPDADTQANWLVASNYLAYAGNLGIVRTVGANALNASDGDASGATATISAGGDDTGGTDWATLTGASKVGITTNATPSVAPTLDYNVTDGVITGTPTIDTPAFTGAVNGQIYYAFVSGGDGNAIVAITATANTAASVVLIYGGTGYPSTGGGNQPIIIPTNAADVDLTATLAGSGTALDSITNIAAIPAGTVDGDYFVVINSGGTDAAFQISGTGGGSLVTNSTDWATKLAGGYVSNSFIAKYAGTRGNALAVAVIASDETDLANVVDGSIDIGNNFDYVPDTTDFVANRGGADDEVHVAVYDKTGAISGKVGTILETFAGVSLATDAKDSFGNSNYIVDVLDRRSAYVYFTGDWTSVSSGTSANWENKDSSTNFSTGTIALGAAFKAVALGGGVDDNSTSGGNGSAKRITGYDLFADKETVDVSFLIGGVGISSNDGKADGVANQLLTIAENRKDCVAFVSPPLLTNSVDITSPSVTVGAKADAIVSWQNLNSSYVIVDSGWKKSYNRYTDTYVPIPINGDTAGLTALTELTNDAWWSPAGYNRGNVRNVYELYFNPDQAARDKLYKAGVNPVVSFPGQGVVLFGDKTSQKKTSAFDRINVRRLFIHIEKAISTAAKFFMFEFNDEFTRAQFRNMVEPFLRDVKARRGIFDYQVVCDSSNNTANVIDRNEFVGDIYIKPARSINFIRLNFVAVRTGVEFSEVAG